MIVKLLIKWVLLSAVIMLMGTFIQGITVDNFITAMVVAVVMTLVNLIIKPIIKLITLPINMMTLGLFTLVINAGLFMLVAFYIPGIEVVGFVEGLIGSLILSILSVPISWI